MAQLVNQIKQAILPEVLEVVKNQNQPSISNPGQEAPGTSNADNSFIDQGEFINHQYITPSSLIGYRKTPSSKENINAPSSLINRV